MIKIFYRIFCINIILKKRYILILSMCRQLEAYIIRNIIRFPVVYAGNYLVKLKED